MAGTDYPYGSSPRPDVVSLIPRDAKSVLDVGCGAGDFGALLKSTYPHVEVWGMDIAEAIAETARQRLDRFVLGGFPDDLPDRRFDCITFNDVLEHLVDPWGALHRTRDLLETGGCVIASIPTVRNYAVLKKLVVNGEWTYRDTGILDRTHLRFFTRKSAMDLFEGAGFSVSLTRPVKVATGGRALRLLAAFGKRTEEFRSQGYVYVANPS